MDYYVRSPADDPTGPTRGEERVYRGGGWFNRARGFRSSSRSGDRPENRHLTLGFRVVVAADQPRLAKRSQPPLVGPRGR